MTSPTGQRKRLVMCFDGTGNKFSGEESDTNIVKLYQMFSRTDPNQFHYYQPGIGTYSTAKKTGLGGPLSKLSVSVEETLDQGFATSFEEHIAAGYRFLMRYYSDGDDVYIFGFSRGAYTARFLAEMLQSMGLLSNGNEEMVYFAWKAFSDYQRVRHDSEDTKKQEIKTKAEKFMVNFRNTYCRPQFQVYFLGLFDCVNSVGQFDIPLTQKQFAYIPSEPALHIRHAVSLHERRVKFKPALFLMQDQHPTHDTTEMWFAGNHGDIGGGWDPQSDKGVTYLHSNTALKWMLGELLAIKDASNPEDLKGPRTDADKLAFKENTIEAVNEKERAWENQLKSGISEPAKFRPHDMLAWGRGAKWFMTMFWWLLEILPTNRLEYEKRKDGNWGWVPRHYPSYGSSRDKPQGAHVHPSVRGLINAGILHEKEVKQATSNNANDTSVPAMPNGTSNGSAKRKQK